jgi:1-deoxy-D-xylulose-5-phosphate reductoisomerase
MQDLTFERPDLNRFPCLALAYESIRLGGNAACIVNAANEVVNLAFRQDKCGFLQMADIISECLSKVPFIKQPTLEDYLETDRITRIAAAEML